MNKENYIMKMSRNIVTTEKPTCQLKTIENGIVFRFSETSFDSALEDNCFYMKIQSPERKDGRVEIINIFDGLKLSRDEDRQVIKHYTNLQITE